MLKEEEEGEPGAQSADGESRGAPSSPCAPRRACQGPHTTCEVRASAKDDDHERQAAFLHAPGPARAQVSRPALGCGGHAQSLSARPAGTSRSGLCVG